MPVYSTHHAKTHLSELIRMDERGETITITRGQIPAALLVRIGATPQPRRSGTLAATMRLNPAPDFRDGPIRGHRHPRPERRERDP
jgi:antitoxin (DNA-binding transcriptional repressor) of toxin-antitoxin stability system